MDKGFEKWEKDKYGCSYKSIEAFAEEVWNDSKQYWLDLALKEADKLMSPFDTIEAIKELKK